MCNELSWMDPCPGRWWCQGSPLCNPKGRWAVAARAKRREKVHSWCGKTWAGKRHHIVGQLEVSKLCMKHNKSCLNVLSTVFIKIVLKTTFLVVLFLFVSHLLVFTLAERKVAWNIGKCSLPTKRHSFFPILLRASAQLYLWNLPASLSKECLLGGKKLLESTSHSWRSFTWKRL